MCLMEVVDLFDEIMQPVQAWMEPCTTTSKGTKTCRTAKFALLAALWKGSKRTTSGSCVISGEVFLFSFFNYKK